MSWFLVAAAALAADAPLDAKAYGERFSLLSPAGDDLTAVEACLRSWPGNPFGTPESRKVRVIESAVRIMGMGSQEVTDTTATAYPQLVLLRPSVSVMTKTTWKLQNPNGWYCFDNAVAVMAKGVVELGCGARLADAQAPVVVGGSTERGGVTVLGSMPVQHNACPAETPAP